MAASPGVVQDVIQSARIYGAVTPEFEVGVLSVLTVCIGGSKFMGGHPVDGVHLHWAYVLGVESCVEVPSYKAWLALFIGF